MLTNARSMLSFPHLISGYTALALEAMDVVHVTCGWFEWPGRKSGAMIAVKMQVQCFAASAEKKSQS